MTICMAAHISSPEGMISSAGKMNALLPVSLSSTVKANLDPNTPLYQSSEAPAAGSDCN